MGHKKKNKTRNGKIDIKVEVATLDVSIQYKGTFLNNTRIEFFTLDGTMDTLGVPLGDAGAASIKIALMPDENVQMRIFRSPKPPQDDPSLFPVLGGQYDFGPITGDAVVKIVVVDASK